MGTHTPGPWEHENTSQHTYAWIVLTKDFDEDANRGTVLCRVSDGLGEADARLIAAAPDLLAACEAFATIEESGGSCVCGYCGKHRTKHEPKCPVRMARAALAKAKGGEA